MQQHPTIPPAPLGILPQTRERLLDAAEALFAQQGLHGVSTRDITRSAGANVGSINYYFGGKHGLVLAIFERRLKPLDAARIKALEAAEEAAGDAPPTVEAIVEALVRPMLNEAYDLRPGHANFARLVGRLVGETCEPVEQLRRTYFIPLINRFSTALHRAIPGVSEEDLYWRLVFTFGALHFMVLVHHIPSPNLPARKPDGEAQLRRIVSFAAAGLLAGRTP